MSDTALKIAVVGSGPMGRHHAIAVGRVPGAKVVAVVDLNAAVAEALATELGGGVRHFADLGEMLAAARPDVVHIVTPPAAHFAQAKRCLEAGASVYIEKPFTESLAEAEALIALAAKRGLQLCAGHQLLFEKPTLVAAELMPQVGTVLHVESFFAFRPSRRPDGRTPRTAVEQLVDIVPHPVYLLAHFLGADRPDGEMNVLGLRVDERGEARAMVTSGEATGMLVVTLRGRPVDSYVKIVGTRGSMTLDYVRGIVIPALHQGTTIDKIVDPYARAQTIAAGSTKSLANRLLKKQLSYPGLAEAFGAFYAQIRDGAPAPVTVENIRRTVELSEQIATRLGVMETESKVVVAPDAPPTVAVTGGTGMLGRKIVDALVRRGVTPLVLARRVPPRAERSPDAHYLVADLGGSADLALPPTIEVVIHAAAETVGKWEAHQRNSIDATTNVLDAMRAAGVKRLVHVSSLAVLDADAPEPLSEESPLERDPKRRGPYVWGKLESERIAQAAPETHGIEVRVVRPGALVDNDEFAPPGKLGRAVGKTFVVMGSPGATIPIADVAMVGEVCAWMALHFADAPALINAVDPEPATRRDLVKRVKSLAPGTRAFWIPAPLLAILSGAATVAQKMLRPKNTAVSVKTAFDAPRMRTDRVRDAMKAIAGEQTDGHRDGTE